MCTPRPCNAFAGVPSMPWPSLGGYYWLRCQYCPPPGCWSWLWFSLYTPWIIYFRLSRVNVLLSSIHWRGARSRDLCPVPGHKPFTVRRRVASASKKHTFPPACWSVRCLPVFHWSISIANEQWIALVCSMSKRGGRRTIHKR